MINIPKLHYDSTIKAIDDLNQKSNSKSQKLNTSDKVFSNMLLRTKKNFHKADELIKEFTVGMPHSNYFMMRMMAAYNYFGQNTYFVGPTLQEMLANTDLKGMRKEDIEFPFSAFYIVLGNSSWEVFGGERTGWHPLTGIYVERGAYKNESHALTAKGDAAEKDFISIYAWGPENNKSIKPGDDASFWYTLPLEHIFSDKGLKNIDEHLVAQLNDSTNEIQLPFLAKLEAGIFNYHGPFIREKDVKAKSKWDGSISLNRFVFNLILYLTSSNAEKTLLENIDTKKRKNIKKQLKKKNIRGRQRRKLKDQLADCSQAKIIQIGRTTEHKYKRSSISNNRSGRKLGRTWRPGYFNHYWVGSKVDPNTGEARLGERRLRQWVQPYLINADMVELVKAKIRMVYDESNTIGNKIDNIKNNIDLKRI